jgi:hypothetical protein
MIVCRVADNIIEILIAIITTNKYVFETISEFSRSDKENIKDNIIIE